MFGLRSLNFYKTKNKLPIARCNTAPHLKGKYHTRTVQDEVLKKERSHTLTDNDARTRGGLNLN